MLEIVYHVWCTMLNAAWFSLPLLHTLQNLELQSKQKPTFKKFLEIKCCWKGSLKTVVFMTKMFFKLKISNFFSDANVLINGCKKCLLTDFSQIYNIYFLMELFHHNPPCNERSCSQYLPLFWPVWQLGAAVEHLFVSRVGREVLGFTPVPPPPFSWRTCPYLQSFCRT